MRGNKRPPSEDIPEESTAKRQKTEDVEVKEEPVNLSIRPGRDVNMTNDVSDALDNVAAEMGKTFKMVDIPFEELIDVARVTERINIQERTSLLLTDPPYNVRREGGAENSDHDVFTHKNVEDLCDFAKSVLKTGGHGIIFCSFSQFENYRSILANTTENVRYIENGKEVYKVEQVFTVESTPLVFVRADGNFNNTNRNPLTHINMVELCVHFWRRGLSMEQHKKNIDYKTPNEFGCSLPPWTNVITNVQIPTGSEVVYLPGDEDDSDNRRQKFRPEQKPISLLKYLINKFCRPGSLVVDACAGTYSTMTACMALGKHRRFVGCDRDESCSVIVQDAMIRFFSQQVHNPQSDITVNSLDIRKDTQTVVEYCNSVDVKKRADAWHVPPGLVPQQNFPPHIVQFFCQYYNDFSLYPHRHFPMIKWNLSQIQKMNSLDIKSILAYEAHELRIMVKPSTIRHPDAGLGAFTTRPLQRGDTVGYYYGALVYGNIGVNHRLHKRYGVGVLAVTSADFEKWSAHINDFRFTDRNNNRYDGYVAPAPFCAMRYINDPRYRQEDKQYAAYCTYLEENKKKPKKTRTADVANSSTFTPRTPNVKFETDTDRKGNRDFELYTSIRVVATKTIAADSELFVAYGDKYRFPSKQGPKSGAGD